MKQVGDYFFKEDDVLGKGQYGFVYKGVNVRSNDQVAIKVIPLHILESPFFQERFLNEVRALTSLASPYIIKYIDLKITARNAYLVTEYCDGGDLGALLARRRQLPEDEVLDILWQLCQGFDALMKCNLLHRDIKPPNILLKNGRIKLADLGFAKRVTCFKTSISESTVGSPVYMSPQVLFKEKYTSKCDVWSFGIMAYQLLFGIVPWHSLDMNELANMVKTKPLVFPSEPQISTDIKDLIIKCLIWKEEHRLSWEEVFVHRAIKRSRLAQESLNEATPMKKDSKPQLNIASSVTEDTIRSKDNVKEKLSFCDAIQNSTLKSETPCKEKNQFTPNEKTQYFDKVRLSKASIPSCKGDNENSQFPSGQSIDNTQKDSELAGNPLHLNVATGINLSKTKGEKTNAAAVLAKITRNAVPAGSSGKHHRMTTIQHNVTLINGEILPQKADQSHASRLCHQNHKTTYYQPHQASKEPSKLPPSILRKATTLGPESKKLAKTPSNSQLLSTPFKHHVLQKGLQTPASKIKDKIPSEFTKSVVGVSGPSIHRFNDTLTDQTINSGAQNNNLSVSVRTDVSPRELSSGGVPYFYPQLQPSFHAGRPGFPMARYYY